MAAGESAKPFDPDRALTFPVVQINTVSPTPVATPVENMINKKLISQVRSRAVSDALCSPDPL